MENNSIKFKVKDIEAFKSRALSYASSYSHLHFFNPNDNKYPYNPFRQLLFFGIKEIIPIDENSVFDSLIHENQKKNRWLIGYLSYDLKNEIETNLSSSNKDGLAFPVAYFYEPKHIIEFRDDEIIITSNEATELYKKIKSADINLIDKNTSSIELKQRISKSEYLNTIHDIKENILEGDFYELNFCQEFFNDDIEMDNLENLYLKLCKKSPSPFSVFQKINNDYLLSSSPERFLKKEGTKLISQPIKGTSPRGESPQEDELSKTHLLNSEKEIAENMMIVDLVRNDFSKFCKTGSVKPEELFGIYSFKQVHQMISTISAETTQDKCPFEIIRNMFPMGSMTGAPKKSAMEFIEKYEKSKRGLYSGTVGYITPDNDFDFNVVIRSILYNRDKKYLSLQVGSAITFDSDAEAEYEECLLKAKGVKETLNH